MGFLANVANVFKIGFNSLTDYKSSDSIYGLGRKYKINQENRDVPFEQGYAKSSDLYSIVNKIVSNAITVPWVVKKKTGDDIEILNEGELFDLVQQPNPEQTRMQYAEQGLNHLLVGGNVFYNSLVGIGAKAPAETYLLHPQLTEIATKMEGKFIVPKGYSYRIGGKEFTMTPEEITHLKYTNPTEYGINNLYGLSPLTAGALTLIGLNNNKTAQASILEHQGAAGILSNEAEYFLNDKESKKQQDLLDAEIGGAEMFGKIIQSRAKIKYTKLGLDPAQLKIIESKLLMSRDLLNIYDVKSALFNDTQGTTFNNIKSAEKQLWTGPITAALGSFLASYDLEVVQKFNAADFSNGKSKYIVEADYSSVDALQEDKLKKANKDKAVVAGIKEILDMPISTTAKIAMLMRQYGFALDEAEVIVSPEGKKNATLEILKSLSPLLANKLIESLSEDEIRALLK